MADQPLQAFLRQLALALLVGAAIGAFAYSLRTLPAWVLLLPCAASLFAQLKRIPPGVAALARWLAWVSVAGAVVLGFIFMAYPVLSAQTATHLTLLAGYALASFSVLFLLGRSAWPEGSTLIPTALGTLAVAAFNTAARLDGAFLLAGIAGFSYLALGEPAQAKPQRLRVSLPWWFVRLLCCIVGVCLLAGLTVWILPRAQTRLEEATFRFFQRSATNYSSLSLHSRLGDLERLKLSAKVVLRVWTWRPQKLRGRVFTEFDGQAWHAREQAVQQLSQAPSDFVLGGSVGEWLDTIPGTVFTFSGFDLRRATDAELIRTKVVQSEFNSGMLVSPGGKVLIRLPAPHIQVDPFERVASPMSTPVEIYGMLNRRSDDVVQTESGPLETLEQCLAVPEDTDRRLRDLAGQLAGETQSPEEHVRRTVQFVQNQCHYSLEVGRFHSAQPVAEFFFEKRRGYCEYFASAAVVLLRLQGVPCRYVTGFNVQEGNRQGGHYVVREADAHAWIEAYVPGRGWIEADPTPEAEYQSLRAQLRTTWWDDISEWIRAELAEISVRFQQGDWRAAFRWFWSQAKTLLLSFGVLGTVFLLASFILMVVGVTRSWRKPGRRRAGPARAATGWGPTAKELADLMWRLDRPWAQQGLARPESCAPLEHLAAIPPERITAEVRETCRKIVECFYRAVFGGFHVPAEETQELRRSFDRLSVP
jgi:hypothetical protein